MNRICFLDNDTSTREIRVRMSELPKHQKSSMAFSCLKFVENVDSIVDRSEDSIPAFPDELQHQQVGGRALSTRSSAFHKLNLLSRKCGNRRRIEILGVESSSRSSLYPNRKIRLFTG